MKATTLPALLILGFLAGCTSAAPEVPLPPDHPANPLAPESPPPQMSQTLRIDSTQPAGDAATTREAMP